MTDELLRLRISHIQAETADATSYFLAPADGLPVPYSAGQFLTLVLTHNGHEVRRSYSLASAPAVDAQLRLTIKRVPNGEISRWLHNTLRVGDVLTSLAPAGRFTPDDNQTGDVLLFGAGSGITPLFGLLKQILATQPNQRVTLLYSNSTEKSIIFRTELDDWQRRYPDRFRIVHLLSSPSDDWPGRRGNVRPGRLNNVLLEHLLPDLIGASERASLHCYVCGPADYMRMVRFTLIVGGFRPEQIKQEDFVIRPVTLAPPPALAVDRTVRLRRRGQDAEITVPAYKSILQAALDEGIRLPYSCRGGRCSTCVARCTAGRVHMTINDVLTERDLADGYVLTCTGYPESDGVVLEV